MNTLILDPDTVSLPIGSSLFSTVKSSSGSELNTCYWQGELDAALWLVFAWKDKRLAWNPEEYHNLTDIRSRCPNLSRFSEEHKNYTIISKKNNDSFSLNVLLNAWKKSGFRCFSLDDLDLSKSTRIYNHYY